jgi:hypothetical protein
MKIEKIRVNTEDLDYAIRNRHGELLALCSKALAHNLAGGDWVCGRFYARAIARSLNNSGVFPTPSEGSSP